MDVYHNILISQNSLNRLLGTRNYCVRINTNDVRILYERQIIFIKYKLLSSNNQYKLKYSILQ